MTRVVFANAKDGMGVLLLELELELELSCRSFFIRRCKSPRYTLPLANKYLRLQTLRRQRNCVRTESKMATAGVVKVEGPEFIAWCIAAKLQLDLEAKEEVSSAIEVGIDRITAARDIAPGEELYRGRAFMSYLQAPEMSTAWLTAALCMMTPERLAKLDHYTSTLYPRPPDLVGTISAHFETTREQAAELAKMPVYRICIKALSNEFGTGQRRWVYSKASKWNHSCYPNCYRDEKEGVLRVIAIRAIPKGSESTFLYWDCPEAFADHPRHRKAYIRSTATAFECTCVACSGTVKKTPRDFLAECKTTIPGLEKYCVNCGKLGDKRCGRCKVPYCGRECQREHWKYLHKQRCTSKT